MKRFASVTQRSSLACRAFRSSTVISDKRLTHWQLSCCVHHRKVNAGKCSSICTPRAQTGDTCATCALVIVVKCFACTINRHVFPSRVVTISAYGFDVTVLTIDTKSHCTA
ncbi:hypothetical protein J6590_038502 [Homalodisca vitripennis]|nr:hypothetical protein J6590_038502 [Homalodisca vitripennis]